MSRPRCLALAGASAIVALAWACTTAPPQSPQHEALREAERAFARHAEIAGIRTAFLAAFADDGILMTPAPMRLEDAYAARPAPADPRAARLEWGPVASGIAASGDFGYTSGPSTFSLRDGSIPPRHGAYFSVWKHDGTRWRVAIDAGITSPEPIAPDALLPSAVIVRGASDDARIEAVLAQERGGPLDASRFFAMLASDARLYRDGGPPVAGERAIRATLAGTLPFELSPVGGEAASSGDLAYSYGAWRSQTESGHYVHLWTRSREGAWKIAVAIRLGAS